MTHVCVNDLTIIGSDNCLSPGRRQAIICTNAWILLIGPLRTNFSEILIEMHAFSFKKIHLKMSSAKWRPFCLVLNVLRDAVVFAHPPNINRHFQQWQFPANVRYHRTDLCGLLSHCSSTGIPCRDQKNWLYDISYAQLGTILAIYNGLRMRTTF